MTSSRKARDRTSSTTANSRIRIANITAIPRTFVAGLCFLSFTFAVIFGFTSQQGDGLNDAIGVFSCFLPLILYVIASGRRMASILEPCFGLLASVGFLVFFLAGFIQYLNNGREIGFSVIGPVASDFARDTLLGCALVTCMLVVGDRFGRSQRESVVMPPTSGATSSISLLSQVLWILAFYGCLDVASSFGGFSAASAQLALHDRNVGIESSGTLGMSLWATFALPAVTTLFIVMLDIQKSTKFRLLALLQAATLLGFGISMFGSRLLLVLSLVSLAFAFFRLYGRGPSLKVITSVLILLMFVSTSVLGGRAEALNTTHDATFLDSIGYSIFDVSIAAVGSLEELRPQLGSTERALTALSAAIPGSGGRAADISAARVDVLVVQAIGTQAQATNSGLPPSLPTSLLLGYELAYALAIALLIGIGLGAVTRTLSRSKSPIAVVFFGLWGAFLFNAFKGGDLPLDLGSEARRWAYVFVMYLAISVFIRKEKTRFDY